MIFYRTVVPKLLKLDPRLIAEGLTSLLLSRFVLLEPTAADHMLPHLLAPRMGEYHVHDVAFCRCWRHCVGGMFTCLYVCADICMTTLSINYTT